MILSGGRLSGPELCLMICLLWRDSSGQLADCQQLFLTQGGRAAGECAYKYGRTTGNWAGTLDKLSLLVAEHPQEPWLLFYLAAAHSALSQPQACALFEQAAEMAHRQGNAMCEVWARINLSDAHLTNDDPAEAARQLDLLTTAANGSDDGKLRAMAGMAQVRFRVEIDGDLDNAERILLEIQAFSLGEAGNFNLRTKWHLYSGLIAFRRGAFDQAHIHWEAYRREVERKQRGDMMGAARFNLLNCDIRRLPPSPENRAQLIRRAREGLTGASEEDFDRHRYTLGKLVQGAEGRQLLEQGLARVVRDEPENVLWRVAYLGALAANLSQSEPARAEALLAQATKLMAESYQQFLGAINWDERLTIAWRLFPRHRALAESARILDTTEAIGKVGLTDVTRGEMLSAWTDAYYWLSGHLLREGRPDGQEIAFATLERLRARALLEAVRQAESEPRPAYSPRRATLLQQIADLQRTLLDPERDQAARQRQLARLELLEMKETTERERAAKGANRDVAKLDIANLAEIRGALRPHEALLSFQLQYERNMYGDFAGGSWLWVITAERAEVLALPDRIVLEPALETYLGLQARGDDALVAPVGAAIYARLLAPALAALPARIDSLVLVPDGLLHSMPFAALRPEASAEPLGRRYRLALAPSATLWLHWRQQASTPAQDALVLADPSRTAGLGGPFALGPLPFARREARALANAWGGDCLVLEGEAASESRLKHENLAAYGLLHFAAHAVTDPEHPDRSAVVLAPGSAEDDGLLQPREIAELDLRHKLVVLSTCRSAAGRNLRGEGVLSLSRAFIRAGSQSVVASLWPLRDDHAERFFAEFYRHLAKGRSTGAALRLARLALIEAGASERDWAGVVLIGDGDYVPCPGGRPSWHRWYKWPVALVALLCLSWAARRWRRAAASRQ